jgi:hypothetical protein
MKLAEAEDFSLYRRRLLDAPLASALEPVREG